jgi:PIF1-like helicase
MPLPQEDWDQQLGNHLILEQRNYNPVEQAQLAADHIPTLNAGQLAAYDAIMHAVNTHSRQFFFLNGPGRPMFITPSTTYANIVICVVSFGIATTLIIRGCTSYFRFKIPINLHEGSTCSISRNSIEAELLHQTRLIIIDEITIQHCHAAEAIDRLL